MSIAPPEPLLPPEHVRRHRPAVAAVAVGKPPQQRVERPPQFRRRAGTIVLARVAHDESFEQIAFQRLRFGGNAAQIIRLRMRLPRRVVAPPRRREFQHGDARGFSACESRERHPALEVEVDTAAQRRGVAPVADLRGDFAPMQPTRRRRVLVGVGATAADRPGDAMQAVRMQHQAHRTDEVGAGRCRLVEQLRQVPRKPQVVVAQVGNIASACPVQALVVRHALDAGVDGEVVPVEARVAERANHRFAAVGAGIADDPRFEVAHVLCDEARDRAAQRRRAVVRRDDDADRRQGWGGRGIDQGHRGAFVADSSS